MVWVEIGKDGPCCVSGGDVHRACFAYEFCGMVHGCIALCLESPFPWSFPVYKIDGTSSKANKETAAKQWRHVFFSTKTSPQRLPTRFITSILCIAS